MSEKSMSKDTRKNVILLHIAVMCFSCSGVIGQYVQVPAVQVAMGRVICSSLLLLAISLVCKDKLTLDSKKDYGLMILTGVVMAIHWSSFFQSIQTSSVAIGTITFSTFPLFLTFLEPLLFHEKICGKNILNALILLMGVLITIPEFSVENKVTIGILWGMLASFTYAVMTLSNRYFSSRYKGRTICLYEQGTAAIALLPALVLVCLLLVLGAVLGFAVCRAVPQQDRQELSDYLHQYAQATADGRGPSASALSVAAAYFRYPLAAALLGLTAAGLVLLPVLSVAQGFFLSFSVGCFARALGRGGVYLALAAFGPRCLFVLPCTLLLTVQGLSAAARRRDGQKVRLTEGAYWRRVGLCGLILLIGAALELTFGPRLLQWVIARTL